MGGRLLTEVEKEQRWQLIAMIRLKGFSQVMEEAAYTWFNRFIALRFMEVNGYLPSKVRVFTDETGAFKPEILKEVMSIELEGLDVYIHLSMGFCASSFLAVSAIQIFVCSGMMCLHRGAVLMSCLVNAVVTSSLLI